VAEATQSARLKFEPLPDFSRIEWSPRQVPPVFFEAIAVLENADQGQGLLVFSPDSVTLVITKV